MKRMITVLLVLAICLLSFPFSVFAQKEVYDYSEEDKEFIYNKYITNEHMLDALFTDDVAVGYWKMIHNIEKDKVLSWAIEQSSEIIEEYPDEQDYVEILTNLMVMQSGSLAEQIQKQSQFDDLKAGSDYVKDIIDIAKSLIGGAHLLEDVSNIIDAVTDGTDLIIENSEQAKYYEMSIRDYSQSKMFLEAVSKYTKNKELKNAASSLITANDRLFQKRIEYLSDSMLSVASYSAKLFHENFSFALIKDSDIYKTDDVVKCYVDCGEKLIGSLKSIYAAGDFSFNLVMLAGDLGFGTSDTFNRYQEMKIVSDIASAIVEANNRIKVPANYNSSETLNVIQTKCDYYKMLIVTHARGEYLVYQLLVKDAGALSAVRVIQDFFKEQGETTDSWYNAQVDIIIKYSDILDNMFVLPEENRKPLDVAEIPLDAVEFEGHFYYVYDLESISSWDEAKQYCEEQGGYLATITSREEDEFVYSYLRDDFDYESAYFGFTAENEEGTWEWDNGEVSTYTNWHSGEPNSENPNENYAMYYYKYPEGSWNDGDFGDRTLNSGKSFICEWGPYQVPEDDQIEEPVKITSGERDIVLVLDTSGSMSGTPLEETKEAAVKFVDTILEEDASIGLVAYDDSAEQISDFSVNKNLLTEMIEDISDGGETNIEAGLSEAEDMFHVSNAKKKIIVLMSDGEPNEGKQGEELIAYADELKENGALIYTLGFFEDMEDEKSSAQYLMEQIASDGCHYEVANAEDLVFFFEDMADQINGQKYIYVRIACPVDVSVTYNGEMLSSSEEDLTSRTDFGTLTFEENEESLDQEDDRIKVLRLKEGADYDIQIVGTGRGMMDYTIGFMDENGEYSDFRQFENIRITKQTVIDTVAAVSDNSELNIDENGDGKYDMRLRAKENGYGEEIKGNAWLYIAVSSSVLLLFGVVFSIRKTVKKNKER